MLSDLHWWNKFISVYNGILLLHSSPWSVSDHYFCTDACTAGIGSFFCGHFFHSPFPGCIDPASLSNALLEMLAVTVSTMLWSDELRSSQILVRTDNLNTSRVCVTCGFTYLFMILSCIHFASLVMPILSLMPLVIGTLILSFAPPSMRLLLFIMTPSQSAFALQTSSILNVSGNHLSSWFAGFQCCLWVSGRDIRG